MPDLPKEFIKAISQLRGVVRQSAQIKAVTVKIDGPDHSFVNVFWNNGEKNSYVVTNKPEEIVEEVKSN